MSCNILRELMLIHRKSHDWVVIANDSTKMIEKCAKNPMMFVEKLNLRI